jgi:hypothetical protein
MSKRLFLFLLLPCTLLAGAGPAGALDIAAGYTRSDVGLYEDGNGLYLGLSRNLLPGPGPVDLTVGLEYVVRAGMQPRQYSDPGQGLVLGEAEVKLHYLQPAAFVGLDLPVGGILPRVYGGFSLALKLGESWTEPAGDTSGELTYEDTDFLGHLGLSVRFTRIFVDARYSFGFNEQLIDTTPEVVKAAPDLEEGLGQSENGAKISGFQIGVGMGF